MPESNSNKDKDEFLYPHYSYHGKATPENIVFNANLQEFAQRVNYICNLETGGKMSTEEAYQEIKNLWKQLKSSRQGLKINKQSDDSEH
ncbi:MAG: hypothetical protein BRC33_03270 [Cyanobacteria bacterium SW_9_44_58]|nr:MAG: hypothetical protein BRC33_03270 [Cyanobacteria bacterium SW_9_44_58]